MEKEAEKVAWVKALYEELNLQAIFTQYEEDSYSLLMGLIEQHSPPLSPAIFLGLAHKIYKWKKEPRDYQGREGRFSINYSKSSKK